MYHLYLKSGKNKNEKNHQILSSLEILREVSFQCSDNVLVVGFRPLFGKMVYK